MAVAVKTAGEIPTISRRSSPHR